jgi:hypothetical protein
VKVSALAETPSGAAAPPGEVSVTEPWGPAPGRQFRAVRYLGFSCGDLAEGLSLDASGVQLRGEFQLLEYDALDPPDPLAVAAVRQSGAFFVVELGGVRRVRRVVFRRSTSILGGTLEVYRLDGDRPAAEPSATVESGDEVVVADDTPASAAEADARAPGKRAAAHAPAAHPAAAHAAEQAAAHRVEDTLVFDLCDDFEGAGFALRVTADGAAASLDLADLQGITVCSTPLNPRLGLAPPPDSSTGPAPAQDPLSSSLLFWPDPTSPPAPLINQMEAGQVDAGALLGRALKTHLARRSEELRAAGALLPGRLDVALVVAADAPCRFRFDAFGVDYHLERASLEPPQEKAVLRFPPDRAEARAAAVVLPRGARVVSARVEVSESRVGGAAGEGGAETAAPPSSQVGLAVTDAGWAAQRFDLTEPVLASGFALGVLALAEGTELTVEVRAEAGGAPVGRLLAAGTARPGQALGSLWVGVAFGQAVLVPSGPLWVCLRASRGRAVWLAGTWEAGVKAAQVAVGTAGVAVLRGAEALCSLRPAAGGSTAAAGLRLDIDGQTVAAGPPEDGRLAFEAAAALGRVAGQPGSGPVTAALRFTAQPGALLTVYPPRVVYDV